MDPQEFIDRLYRSLLKQGWSLPDVDAMDIFYYLQLLRQDMNTGYIDEVL